MPRALPRRLFPDPRPRAGSLWRGLRVGLLGGSFNPAHDGHRHISLEALKRLRLDAVWWLVSPQNPLKGTTGMATLAERLASAERVTRHDPRIVVSDIEARLATRFTADTLGRLAKRFPATRFVWLMGADNLVQVPRWHRWHEIFTDMPVAVFDRGSYARNAPFAQAATRFADRRLRVGQAGRLAGQRPPAWVYLTIVRHPATATRIRRQRRARRLFERG
ncbi:MAG: nicotinate-nucleotide adenylyltransferase [Azospirillaceae bacterium]